jgi:hypothetical protein
MYNVLWNERMAMAWHGMAYNSSNHKARERKADSAPKEKQYQIQQSFYSILKK